MCFVTKKNFFVTRANVSYKARVLMMASSLKCLLWMTEGAVTSWLVLAPSSTIRRPHLDVRQDVHLVMASSNKMYN